MKNHYVIQINTSYDMVDWEFANNWEELKSRVYDLKHSVWYQGREIEYVGGYEANEDGEILRDVE